MPSFSAALPDVPQGFSLRLLFACRVVRNVVKKEGISCLEAKFKEERRKIQRAAAMNAPQNGLTIQLFGSPTLAVGGRPTAPLRTRKGLWLLALLALHSGQDVERHWLAATLWADSDASQALYNLRRSLSDLRGVLGDAADCLCAPTSHTLRLVLETEAIDVMQFDAAIARGDAASLDAAIALYRGRLLEGCGEEWALPEAEARERAYLGALKTRAASAREAGNGLQAEILARKAIAVDVLDEAAWRELMAALAQQGNSAALTAAYRDLRFRLLRDFNLCPDAQTTELFEKLRADSCRQRQNRFGEQAGKQNPAVPCPEPLPRLLTGLVGRDEQIALVQDALRRSRLVTLTGSGGVGKTRLAVAVAEEMCVRSPDAVQFVDMAGLQDSRLAAAHLARALNLREEEGCSLETSLCRHLATHPLTLILDNCEHLLEACARLVERLLTQTERLAILATSRIALGLAGEAIWRVPSLELPPTPASLSASSSTEHLLTYSAVQLFVERAQNYRADFRLEPNNAAAVVEICRRLDGIPLALELAAARVRHLALADIAHRLENTVKLLSEGSRTLRRRWQTLQASIEWSWCLLTEPEQILLSRLSVFAGSFTLDAAESVCTDFVLSHDIEQAGQGIEQDEIVDILGALVDHSLIVYPDFRGDNRYRLLETIRQYAGERLRASGEEAMIRRRHLHWCLALADHSNSAGAEANQPQLLARLEQEQENFREAFAFCRASDAEGETGLRLAAALWWFWYVRGYYQEGRSHLEAALTHGRATNFPKERAAVLNGVGNLAVVQGDIAAAKQSFEECLALRLEMGDREGMGSVLGNLGIVACALLDYLEAQRLYEQALALAEEFGDLNKKCAALSGLARAVAKQNDLDRAQSLFEEVFRIAQAQQNLAGIIITLMNLASVAEDRADDPRARQLFTDALEKAHALGDRRSVAVLLEAQARLALRLEAGSEHRAAVLMGAAQTLRQQIGSPLPSEQRKVYDAAIDRLKEHMGTTEFETAFAAGLALEWQAAVALCMEKAAA